MYNGSSTHSLNGNSFSDCSLMSADFIMPALIVSTWKCGVSQAAAMRGMGLV